MATFTWKDFIFGNLAVRCKTKHDFDVFMVECERMGLIWCDGFKPTDVGGSLFNINRVVATNKDCELVYLYTKHATEGGYNIINFDEIEREPAANRQKRAITPLEAVDAAARVMGRAMEELIKIADANGLDRNSFIAKSIDTTTKLVRSSDFSQWKLQTEQSEPEQAAEQPEADATDELAQVMVAYVNGVLKVCSKYKKDRNETIKTCTHILFNNILRHDFDNGNDLRLEVPANE